MYAKKNKINSSVFEIDPKKLPSYLTNEQNDFYFKNSNIENFLFKDSN